MQIGQLSFKQMQQVYHYDELPLLFRDRELSDRIKAKATLDWTQRETVRADMRRMPFLPGSFQAVTQLFTSFGYFEETAEDRMVLAGAALPLVTTPATL